MPDLSSSRPIQYSITPRCTAPSSRRLGSPSRSSMGLILASRRTMTASSGRRSHGIRICWVDTVRSSSRGVSPVSCRAPIRYPHMGFARQYGRLVPGLFCWWATVRDSAGLQSFRQLDLIALSCSALKPRTTRGSEAGGNTGSETGFSDRCMPGVPGYCTWESDPATIIDAFTVPTRSLFSPHTAWTPPRSAPQRQTAKRCENPRGNR